MRPSCAAAVIGIATHLVIVAAAPALGAELPLVLENLANRSIANSYAAPLSAPLYSGHAIAHDLLASGEAADIVLSDVVGCTFNVMVVFADGVTMEQRELDLCAGTTISVHDEGIFLRP